MKVYVLLEEIDYEGSELIDVFKNKKDAENRKEDLEVTRSYPSSIRLVIIEKEVL